MRVRCMRQMTGTKDLTQEKVKLSNPSLTTCDQVPGHVVSPIVRGMAYVFEAVEPTRLTNEEAVFSREKGKAIGVCQSTVDEHHH